MFSGFCLGGGGGVTVEEATELPACLLCLCFFLDSRRRCLAFSVGRRFCFPALVTDVRRESTSDAVDDDEALESVSPSRVASGPGNGSMTGGGGGGGGGGGAGAADRRPTLSR